MADEEPGIIKLGKLIASHALRVNADTPDATNMGFFGIMLGPDSDLTALKLKNAIVRAEQGVDANMDLQDFCAEDISYTRIGIWLGDQGLALAFMGLGAELGLWDIVLPQTVGIVDEALVQRMMGMGFIMIRVTPDSILRSGA